MLVPRLPWRLSTQLLSSSALILLAVLLQFSIAQAGMVAFYNKIGTWTDARDFCRSEGGMLAPIRNEDERDEAAEVKCYSPIWVGANDRSVEGEWMWDSVGEAVVMGNDKKENGFWERGQPDSHQGQEEDCASFGHEGEKDIRLHDYPCLSKTGWICKIDDRASTVMIWDEGWHDKGRSCGGVKNPHEYESGEGTWVRVVVQFAVMAVLGVVGGVVGCICIRKCQRKQQEELERRFQGQAGIPMTVVHTQPNEAYQPQYVGQGIPTSGPHVVPGVVQGELLGPPAPGVVPSAPPLPAN